MVSADFDDRLDDLVQFFFVNDASTPRSWDKLAREHRGLRAIASPLGKSVQLDAEVDLSCELDHRL